MRDSIISLAAPAPFCFQACLSYMRRSPLECLFEADEEGVTRLLQVGSSLRLLRFTCPEQTSLETEAASPTQPRSWAPGATSIPLQVQLLHGAPLSTEEEAELTRYTHRWFDLDRDLLPFYRMAQDDPLLGPLTEDFYGLRLVGVPDLFEALCWAIVGQQVNLAFAYKLKQRLTEQYGESLEWAGRTYRLFPQAERLLHISMEELCGLQLTRNKARTILEVAERIASGELSREKLTALPHPEHVEKHLTSIRGIGPWTSRYVRMRCLLDTGVYPVGDVGLMHAVRHLLHMDRKPTHSELENLFAEWRGWEAYAAFYLWRVLY